MKILNYDVAVSEKLPAINTLGDALLCDFQHYLIGDRQQIEIAYSEHVAFLSNQSVWPRKGLAPPAAVRASGREADGGNREYDVWGTKQGAMGPQSCRNPAPIVPPHKGERRPARRPPAGWQRQETGGPAARASGVDRLSSIMSQRRP